MTHQEKKRPIAVDLFAGAGGMTLGFEQAGFDVLAAVEIDPIHCAIHQFNFPFWSVLCQNITDTTGEEIRNCSSIGNREIDVVFGGPPCQGFSLIGKRVLDDPRNSLVFHFIRLILELQPKFFVMENVAGMARGEHRQLLAEVMANFQSNNYEVQKQYEVLNAAYFGVPQNRERLFLLGCKKGFNFPLYPNCITRSPQSKNSIFEAELPSTPTVWDAIKDLPEVENYPELYQRDWVVADFKKPSNYGRQVRGLTKAQGDYSYERAYDSSILTSSLRTKHTQKSIGRFESTPPGKTEPISRFFKLDPEGLCNTLRAGTASNRGAFTSPRPIHPFVPRCITVREAARLHSYPDWFIFHPTKWHGFRQVGNSVPPMLARAVAAEIIKALGVYPSKPKGMRKLGNEELLRLDMSKAAKLYGVDPHVIEPRIRKSAKRNREKTKDEPGS